MTRRDLTATTATGTNALLGASPRVGYGQQTVQPRTSPRVIGRRRNRPRMRRFVALAIGFAALFTQSSPLPANAVTTWSVNLYDWRAFLYQDPYPSACTAASAMIMLNVIAYRQAGGEAFRWTPYRVKNNKANPADHRDMTSILSMERAHDTLALLGSGSDAHGWGNALNYYGWGLAAMRDPAQSVYDDLEFSTYDRAVHAAVRAIARYGMPVGIVGWAGRHAQVMTGYVVDGEDPTISDAFTVRYVYLSDPLYKDHMVNVKITNSSFKAGALRLRFQAYRETDSPYDDPYTAGFKRSSVSPTRGPSEWYHRWVILAPIRAGMPVVDPPPNPDPSPTPTPEPNPTPTSEPQPTPTATPEASVTVESAPTPTATPSDTATSSSAGSVESSASAEASAAP